MLLGNRHKRVEQHAAMHNKVQLQMVTVHAQEEAWVQVLDPEVSFHQLYGLCYSLEYTVSKGLFAIFNPTSVLTFLYCRPKYELESGE
jgi:hypothetical protein